ncbi:MAG: hypothetical protein AABX93_01350 [Nanoarchaeota archaeon]
MKDLIGLKQSIEKLPDVFSKHGFNSGFSTDSFSASHNFNQIYETARELNFELPNSLERFFTLFHNLGSGDFDAAYLYDINSAPIAMNGNPKLENMTGLAEDLTSEIPDNNLVIFYENERFAIPKISLYRNGKLERESAHAGKEKYREDYWKGDNEKANERGKKAVEKLAAFFREVLKP